MQWNLMLREILQGRLQFGNEDFQYLNTARPANAQQYLFLMI
jgi:hypothetical protein